MWILVFASNRKARTHFRSEPGHFVVRKSILLVHRQCCILYSLFECSEECAACVVMSIQFALKHFRPVEHGTSKIRSIPNDRCSSVKQWIFDSLLHPCWLSVWLSKLQHGDLREPCFNNKRIWVYQWLDKIVLMAGNIERLVDSCMRKELWLIAVCRRILRSGCTNY